jgi:hypothetical protein
MVSLNVHGKLLFLWRVNVTDMQMPRSFWYWALQQAVFVLNYLPCTVSQVLTSPHELVYGVKPDYWLLFC